MECPPNKPGGHFLLKQDTTGCPVVVFTVK